MDLKMIIFQKSNHSNSSAKMIIFRPILNPILLTRFQAPPQTFVYILTVTLQPFDVFSMAPKAKKSASAALKPQSASAPKRVRKPSSKATESVFIDSADEEDATSQPPPAKACRMMRISWTTARTERLLDWLEENPVDRQKLFSDSTKDAKDEGRRKHVAKGTKSEFHKLIAVYVFSVDTDKGVRDDFVVNSGNYTKSVDNYLGQYVFSFFSFNSYSSASSRLRKEYRLFNEKLGQTGAGLRYKDVKEGSNLSNLIDLFLFSFMAYSNPLFQNNLSRSSHSGSVSMVFGERSRTLILIQLPQSLDKISLPTHLP